MHKAKRASAEGLLQLSVREAAWDTLIPERSSLRMHLICSASTILYHPLPSLCCLSLLAYSLGGYFIVSLKSPIYYH